MTPNRKVFERKDILFHALFFIFHFLLSFDALGQYTLNGTAVQDKCNCYTLTTETTYQAGAVWNNYPIDLKKSFNFTFDVYLGCLDSRGADGLVFTLQKKLSSLGTSGLGEGFEGIGPSVGVSLDTYQNLNYDDPAYDHLAIQVNGDLSHRNRANNIAGPVQISSVSRNVEDCNWHTLTVNWDAATQEYDISFDGIPRLSVVKDFVADIFGGNSVVYWGFTGSTGAFTNVQKFCLPLSTYFKVASNQRKCAGDAIQFIDSSRGGNTIRRYWDFGDGSGIDSISINPVHSYASSGDYQVVLSVKGVDECIEQYKQTITIVKPIAGFGIKSSCQQNTILKDSSYTNSGRINSWYWTFGNGSTSTQQNPVTTYSTPGSKSISLLVKTDDGCASDTVRKTIIVDPQPSPVMSFNDACKNDPVNFSATDNSGTAGLTWYWNLGDGVSGSGNSVQHVYTNTGDYNVSVYAVTTNGCISKIIPKIIHIYGTNVNAGPDIIAAEGQPVQIHATGASSYQWTPPTGLNNANIADPIANLTKDGTYYLKAADTQGCISFDTISIKIYKGPEIYVPNAFSPNNDDINDVFRVIPVGIVDFKYLKIFNRWGRQVFETSDYKIGWDGAFNGSKQPQDVYVWIVAARDFKGNIISKRGTLMLVR